MENVRKINPALSYYKPPVTQVFPFKTLTLHEIYKILTSNYFKPATEMLRSIKDPESNRKYKSGHFGFVTFSGVFSRRGGNYLTKYSELLVIDLDHLQDVERTKQRLLLDPYVETQLLFTSPNGNGLKWIIRVESPDHTYHGQYFDAICNYLKDTYDLVVDKSGRDIARTCFLCYDSDAFLHPWHGNMNRMFDAAIFLVNRKKFVPGDWIKRPEENRNIRSGFLKSSTRQQLETETVVRRIEAFGIDLTSQYDDWVRLGYAFANEFGEGGRRYFHRVSQFHSGYRPKECDGQYDACLRSKGSGVTLRSFFAMAHNAGVNVKC